MSTHQQTSKSKQSDNTPPQKQQANKEKLLTQTQTIHPSVLQRAIENPQTARPEVILQLQRIYGNQAVSRMITTAQQTTQSSSDSETTPEATTPKTEPLKRNSDRKILQTHTDIVQRLIHIPFNEADDALKTFATEHTGGLAPGPVIIGQGLSQKIKVDEDLVLIGHGNGSDFFSHENPENPQMTKLDTNTLADYLATVVLPNNYRGKITIWSCNSARPWKHIPAIKQQLEQLEQQNQLNTEQKEAFYETSFITQLETRLKAKQKGYNPTIVGAIGYITNDRDWKMAKVYENENLKFLGNTVGLAEGLKHTQEEVPGAFYAGYEEDDDASYGENSMSAESPEPETAPTQLSFGPIHLTGDKSGINAGSIETFHGSTQVEVGNETYKGYRKVKIIATTNHNLRHMQGREVWMKQKWLNKGNPLN